ncbi:MAG: alpha/beta fold hydrolase [Salinimicrobium sp.]
MKHKFAALLLFFTGILFAQQTEITSEEVAINEYVNGTLVKPATEEQVPLVIIIQGSGPTDRNGNQPFLQNNSLKQLANGLAEEEIASFRYDKRISQVLQGKVSEQDLSFDDFVEDASAAIDHFKQKNSFKKIIVLGHSQGSLVGMLAAKDKADAFISIAGAAQSLDAILIEQIGQQMPQLKENVEQTIKELKETGTSSSYNPALQAIFRPSVQPFLVSWMKYDPQQEIQKLDLPVLLINGNKDLQIAPSEAQMLQKAAPNAKLVIVDKMNHVLKKIEGDDLENSKSYNEPGLPLHPELVPIISDFIAQLK